MDKWVEMDFLNFVFLSLLPIILLQRSKVFNEIV